MNSLENERENGGRERILSLSDENKSTYRPNYISLAYTERIRTDEFCEARHMYVRIQRSRNPFEPNREGKIRRFWDSQYADEAGILRPYCNIFVSHFARQFHSRQART